MCPMETKLLDDFKTNAFSAYLMMLSMVSVDTCTNTKNLVFLVGSLVLLEILKG